MIALMQRYGREHTPRIFPSCQDLKTGLKQKAINAFKSYNDPKLCREYKDPNTLPIS